MIEKSPVLSVYIRLTQFLRFTAVETSFFPEKKNIPQTPIMREIENHFELHAHIWPFSVELEASKRTGKIRRETVGTTCIYCKYINIYILNREREREHGSRRQRIFVFFFFLNRFCRRHPANLLHPPPKAGNRAYSTGNGRDYLNGIRFHAHIVYLLLYLYSNTIQTCRLRTPTGLTIINIDLWNKIFIEAFYILEIIGII